MSAILILGYIVYGLIEGTIIGTVVEVLGNLSRMAMGIVFGLALAVIAVGITTTSTAPTTVVFGSGIELWAWLGRVPGYFIGFAVGKALSMAGGFE